MVHDRQQTPTAKTEMVWKAKTRSRRTRWMEKGVVPSRFLRRGKMEKSRSSCCTCTLHKRWGTCGWPGNSRRTSGLRSVAINSVVVGYKWHPHAILNSVPSLSLTPLESPRNVAIALARRECVRFLFCVTGAHARSQVLGAAASSLGALPFWQESKKWQEKRLVGVGRARWLALCSCLSARCLPCTPRCSSTLPDEEWTSTVASP